MADIIQNPTLSKLRSLFLLSLKTFVGFVEEEEKRGRKEILHTYLQVLRRGSVSRHRRYIE